MRFFHRRAERSEHGVDHGIPGDFRAVVIASALGETVTGKVFRTHGDTDMFGVRPLIPADRAFRHLRRQIRVFADTLDDASERGSRQISIIGANVQ